jgi:hypothetical protein
VNRLKDDLENLLSAYEPSLTFAEQYSYSPNTLYLKPNHTFLFRRDEEKSQNNEMREQRVLAMVIIFHEDSDLNRMNLKDQPELWFGFLNIKNYDEKCRPWYISDLLKLDERDQFDDEKLMIGGHICNYYWKKSENGEEWNGKFIGYPLTEITDIKVLEEKVVQKLFSVK